MKQRIYPIGIQSFEKLRRDGYIYVDKTALIYKLVTTGSYYFLSRPRRFGKSLLLSTLEAYFRGKRELFEGLAIEQLEQNWTVRPVLHLDLNIGKYDAPDSLDKILDNALTVWEEQYGTGPSETTLALRFKGIVQRAVEQTGHRVAILVDEYDKPMLQAIGNEELQKEYRNTLKPFYGVLKTMDGYIKLGFLTGVTKFGKVSVFSDLNNLRISPCAVIILIFAALQTRNCIVILTKTCIPLPMYKDWIMRPFVLKCRNATTDIISISTRPAFTILSACSILLMQWRSAVIGLPQALLLILSTY